MAASVPMVSAGSIDQRFAQLIQQFGLTKNSFAMSLGKTASVVQHLIDGRNKPGFDLMCKVFEVYPNVSRDWLLLGRGPMLVGSAAAAGLPATAAAATGAPTAPEPPFEPIDLADVAPRAARRPTATRLHPEEIAATLALASAAGEPFAPAVASLPAPSPEAAAPAHPGVAAAAPVAGPPAAGEHRPAPPAPAAYEAPAAEAPPRRAAPAGPPPARPFRPAQTPLAAAPVLVAAAPVPAPPQPAPAPVAELPLPAPAAPVAPAWPAAAGPETYVAAALHAQQLQHQLALAELRNQHLLEQQQMLREMLAMARQNMV